MSDQPIRPLTTLVIPAQDVIRDTDPYWGADADDTTIPPPPKTPSVGVGDLLEEARNLGDDEVLVLTLIAKRLRIGREVYGPLSIRHDTRNWHREALEECADAAVYAAVGLIRRGLK